MLDHQPPPPTPRRRWIHGAAAVLAGVALAFATYWTGDWSSWLALAVILAFTIVLVGVVKLPLPLFTVAVPSMLITWTLIGRISYLDTTLGLNTGLAYTSCFLVTTLVVALVQARRVNLRRGWDLAFAEAREHEVRVERAVALEREAMAGDIHDGLGHRLTLIAVQASRLSLDEQLPEHARAELERIRANAAAASEELGDTVRLLGDRGAGVTASLSGLLVEDVIDRARASGVSVAGEVAPEVEDACNDHTHAALMRALQEGLTNAAKHAPGEAVRVAIDRDGGDVVLRMRNPMPGARPATAPTGHGLVAVRHRAAVLGGSLEIEAGESFALTVRLPIAATPSAAADQAPPTRVGVVTEAAARAAAGRRQATLQAWLVPAAMLLAIVLFSGGYFVYANLTSVLPPERFATIEVGDDREATQRALPGSDMLDAPYDLLPEPPGDVSCHYYEASVSFFERVDVYRICFADDRVASTDTIAP